jgi:type IV pilus assembly protein PilY1
MLTAMLGPGDVRADDVDVYKTTAKNTAMVVFDDSGSMSFPVYDASMDYANFMWWLHDQDLAVDNKTLGENLLGDRTHRTDFWEDNFHPDYPDRTTNKNHEYDRLDPDQIYLVSAISRAGFTLINYIDKNGDPQQKAQVGDFMEHWGTSHNERDDYIDNPIIVVRNSKGDVWKLPEIAEDTGEAESGEIEIDLDLKIKQLSIEVEKDTGDGLYYVVFPTTTLDICEDETPKGCETSDKWYTVTNPYAGQRLPNAQDILVSDLQEDSRTGIVTDKGFLGHLRSAGHYFAGVFEQSGGQLEFTNDHDLAEKEDWRARVYLFATGKFLNFIKLVEDFDAKNRTVNPPGVKDWAWNWAWTNICDKSGGTQEAIWSSQSTEILSFDKETSNYGGTPVGDDLRGIIEPPGKDETQIASIKVKFEYVDTEGCYDPPNGTDNDYVDIQDENGNSLLAIKGQEVKANGSQSTDAAVSYDGGKTWNTNVDILDKDGYTEPLHTDSLRIVWHKGKSGKNCSGKDKGFKITGFKFTTQDTSQNEAGSFYCMNGDDGYGNKILTRMEVAKAVVKKVIDSTSRDLYWGITAFNESPRTVEPLGGSAANVKAAVDALDASGSTPMSEALQSGYDSNYDFFSNALNADEAECAGKFVILMTDGFPNGDDVWSGIISTADDGTPNFSNTGNSYVDDDGWVGLDAQSNYGDDVAYWMYNNAKYKHTVHTIGFGLDHPLLGDIASSSEGIYIIAFNEGQLINAFHSLSLAMTESQSFVAPVVSVDQANRTQSGDKIYTAFFRPLEGEHWIGNLKKYGLRLMARSECGRTKPEWVVVGGDDQPAVDCNGNFVPWAVSIWSKIPDGGEAAKGGVGSVLKDAMPGSHPTNLPNSFQAYAFRNIFTYDSSTDSMVHFTRDVITMTDLAVATDLERDKLINFMYGYTYNAKDATSGVPTEKREWILGDMVHSEPTIIDYLDEDNGLEHRFILVGANDGMLHVFTDQEISIKNAENQMTKYEGGREIWAFIPPDMLSKLKNLSDPSTHDYFVDGFSSLHRAQTFNEVGAANGIRGSNEYYHKTVVFGERRGGNNYWALDVSEPDPLKWTVKWHIQGSQGVLDPYNELAQTWSKAAFATIRTGPNPTDIKDVVIFTGGYDIEEDGFPEVWEDSDEDGIKDDGETYTDTFGGTASAYDYYNPDMNDYGRGIFVVDLATGTPVYRAVYGGADGQTTDPIHGTPIHTFSAMKWSFPADTSVIPLSKRKLVIYAPDVYGQIWKVDYTYTDSGADWNVTRVFEVNPGSDQTGAIDFPPAPGLNVSDKGRKVFYPPDVSYLGTPWSDDPVLFFGTGDRPHPRYVAYNPATGAGYHDRFYVVADTDSSTPANETKLLNLTCDELEASGDADQDGDLDSDDDTARTAIKDILFGITDYPVNGEKARGWYRIMGKQGECTQESRDHLGEKVLSRPTLFFRVTYFTTFQAAFGDPCKPSGDALVYALDYDLGTAAFNLNSANDPDPDAGNTQQDLSDTYGVVEDSTIASGVRVITRKGKAAGVFSAGGSIVGAGEKEGDEGTSTSIPGPPGGASRMLWETF